MPTQARKIKGLIHHLPFFMSLFKPYNKLPSKAEGLVPFYESLFSLGLEHKAFFNWVFFTHVLGLYAGFSLFTRPIKLSRAKNYTAVGPGFITQLRILLIGLKIEKNCSSLYAFLTY